MLLIDSVLEKVDLLLMSVLYLSNRYSMLDILMDLVLDLLTIGLPFKSK
jgi:hypothetical protein